MHGAFHENIHQLIEKLNGRKHTRRHDGSMTSLHRMKQKHMDSPPLRDSSLKYYVALCPEMSSF
jgi:hypothetical protein